jgi:PAS domain S-box-containing protein
MAADIVGQTWNEISRSVVEDLDESVAALFARRETWSGRVIYWQIDNCAKQVPVDWAGMPIFGPNRELIGFRGFGLIRTDAAVERHEAPETQAQAETPEAPVAPREMDGSTGRHSDDDTLPGQNIEEALQSREPAAEVADSDVSERGTEEGWFAGIRERVAATLSGSRAPRSPNEAEKDGQEVRPRAKTPDAHAGLSTTERSAFREIARALGARFEDEPTASVPSATPAPMQADELIVRDAPASLPADPLPQPPRPVNGDGVLDRLPVGVLVHRGERILFANRLLLDLVDYDDIGQLGAEGGVVRLFRGSPTLIGSDEGGSPLALSTRHSESIAVEVRLTTVEWDGLPASLMLIRKIPEADATQRLRGAEMDLRRSESRMRELESILDTATDGVIVLDETGRMLSLNRSAEALFGYDQREVVGDAVTVLLAPESHIVALDYLEGLRSHGVASLLNDGREVQGRVRQGGTIPLFMTMGHVNDGPDRKFCAVLRDITAFKKAESELIAAKRVAEEASAQKSDLLAKISHEIRTPLNAIIGFAEVMLEERFGPIGNERYKDYLRDVHGSGAHVISLVNDLLDLAKIEAGRMDLSFTSVSLNDLVSSCVTLLQPQAGRDRIVMRTSFAPKLPPVVADERSIRQIVLNLVSNAIKFTDAGGQVIVSTALTDRGEVAFRVRDTGIGMTEKEIEAALEPFRQLATSRKRGGTGLGLPLTKALVEANRGALQISSNTNEGTLVEVLFPPTRVLAE